MQNQNVKNHAQMVPGFHYVTLGLILLGLIGSCINLANSVHQTENLYSASLVTLIFVILGLLAWYTRAFALRAQDRAIRAEENLRHFVLSGKLLDQRLRIGQIIALRFASAEEFIALAQKAAEENMTPASIKASIQQWRGDYYRV